MIYIWDELECAILPGPAENTEGWQLVLTYPNGVKRFEGDRHIALEVEASSKEAANQKFAHYCEEYVEIMRGMDI